MPFDRAGFRETPEPSTPGNRIAVIIILLVAIPALVTPFSLGAFVDLVRAVMGN